MNRLSKRTLALALVAAATGLSGCGGGGGNGGGGGGGGTPGPITGGPTVNLGDKPGQIELTYLTGQGRSGVRAEGDLEASLGRTIFQDAGGIVEPTGSSQLSFKLNPYSNVIVRYNAGLLGADSRTFNSYALDIAQISYTFSDTFVGRQTFTTIDGLPALFDARATVFPGRYTSLPIFLNDGQFTFNVSEGGGGFTAAFLPEIFRDNNNLTEENPVINGFLSDYLAFDVTGIPAGERPVLSNGEAAERIYLSGDNYAVSRAASGFGTAGERGRFQLISRTISDDAAAEFGNYIDGRYAPPGTFTTDPAAGTQLVVPGTYSLIQDDPSQPPIEGDEPDGAIAQVVSIQGIWRDYRAQISNQTTEFAITLPSATDDDVQDFLLIRQSTGATPKISAAYFGSVDLTSKEIFLTPIRELATSAAPTQLAGTIATTLGVGGTAVTSPRSVRRGTYTLNAGAAPGFARTGTFVVYRR